MTFERLIRPDLVLRICFLSMSGFNACTWERMNASNVCCSRMKLITDVSFRNLSLVSGSLITSTNAGLTHCPALFCQPLPLARAPNAIAVNACFSSLIWNA